MKLLIGIKYFLAAFAALLLDFTVSKYIAVGGGMPQFMFCFCILASLREKDMTRAAAAAIAAGAAADVLSGHGFGTYTFTFAMSAMATYAVKDKLFSSGFLFLILDAFILTVLSQTVYYLFHITDAGSSFGILFTSVILTSAAYNTVICAVFYPLSKRIFADWR